ncbi:hypothetical protein KL86DYS2_10250 [uncultured Dysgonomonas sp.]|uniref:Uncharacterized protein n=1 Tax=uncultured Dysgonomonas sp. TaxID=206096 RepID=A0A212IXY0_9BACT|nr:hypothetical protein KL86DYS2_10250 [uncultured Dysgonomonas sp.]DAL53861.1 MAG TPA_asm: hypothetical protein [Caudoviricetes sp.]
MTTTIKTKKEAKKLPLYFVILIILIKQDELLQLDKHQHKYHSQYMHLDQFCRCLLLILHLQDIHRCKYRKQYNLH